MKPTGKFITAEELDRLRTAQSCSGMFLSGGAPLGDPSRVSEELNRKYGFIDCGISTKDGQFWERE